MKRRGMLFAFVVFLGAGALGACGDDDDTATTDTRPGGTQSAGQAAPTQVSITANDYAFAMPATIKGGLVKFSYTNAGKEPHFAGIARVAPGKTFADVRAALTAPPSDTPPPGPPPFEEVAGLPTADPGATGNMTVNLPAGSYAFYCLIPAPDGAAHAAKGMISEIQVTEGTDGALPPSVATVTAVDFSFAAVPPLKAGNNVVQLRNQGKQLHEINLVELSPGKRIEDVLAWYRQRGGPPPMRFLSGAAVRPGSDATTELNLKAGTTYAFVCEIPDFLGDFQPHVTKGMHTGAFTVT